MDIWKDGEIYLVKITNPVFGNFGKTIRVIYVFIDADTFGFHPYDEEDDNGEAYIEDDFELVDTSVVEKRANEWVKEEYPDTDDEMSDKLIKAFVTGYYTK